MTRILDKTAKGREEIASRKYGLAPRLRTLLVLIDSKHTQEELLKQVGSLGLNEHSIIELLDGGFISFHESDAPAAEASAPVTIPAPVTAPSASTDNVAYKSPPPSLSENQFQALYNFYTSTIKSAIGLRGYSLQLKVERAESVADFLELRQSYIEAVLQAQGEDMACNLRNRLDQLLYLGKPPPDLDPII